MNVGVFGMGAIGSTIAFYLSKNRNLNLSFFNRSPRQSINIRKGEEQFEIPIELNRSADANINLDWLIICLKAYHFEAAKLSIENLVGGQTKVAVIRNGINLKDNLLGLIPVERILETIIDCPVQPEENNFYKIFSPPKITVPSDPLTEGFASLFLNSNCLVEIARDFKTIAWKKVCESAAFGAILCLTDHTAKVFEDRDIRIFYQQLLMEGIAVAKAEGAQIPSNFVDQMLEKIDQYPADKGSSMLTDRRMGRQIELGAKNGAIVEGGRKNNIDTSMNQLVCVLLRGMGVTNH